MKSTALLSHPTVNGNWRNLALALAEVGQLEEFHTTIAWPEDGRSRHPWIPDTLQTELLRRSLDVRVWERTVCHPLREASRLVTQRLGLHHLAALETAPLSVDNVFLDLSRKVAKRLERSAGIEAVVAGEDGALAIFRAAKKKGLRCIYELPIGYFESAIEMRRVEAERSPEFAVTMPGAKDSAAKLERKREEAALADVILAPSNFVRDTLLHAGIDSSKIRVVPYGAPARASQPPRDTRAGGKLKLLFVGAINQRKGIGYLLDAMQALDPQMVELTLIGTMPSDPGPILARTSSFRHLPPMPNSRVLEMMREHDVFLLPSLFEGFALVILEAMSQGLPVIVTPNSGAEPVVRDGVEGFIVPPRSSQAIVHAVNRLTTDRSLLEQLSANALSRAEEFSWTRYRNALRAALSAV